MLLDIFGRKSLIVLPLVQEKTKKTTLLVILPHIYVKKLCVSRPKIIPAVKKVFTNPRKQSEFEWDWRVWGICENFFHR